MTPTILKSKTHLLLLFFHFPPSILTSFVSHIEINSILYCYGVLSTLCDQMKISYLSINKGVPSLDTIKKFHNNNNNNNKS